MNKFINALAGARMKLSHAAGLFNIFGMPLLIIAKVRELTKLKIHFAILYPAVILGLLVAGYVLDKIGWYKAEMNYSATRNPVLSAIKNQKNNVGEIKQ